MTCDIMSKTIVMTQRSRNELNSMKEDLHEDIRDLEDLLNYGEASDVDRAFAKAELAGLRKQLEELEEIRAAPYACETHGVKSLPSGYDRCPLCMEEQRIHNLEQERMARRADPRMHPTVDAPRY